MVFFACMAVPRVAEGAFGTFSAYTADENCNGTFQSGNNPPGSNPGSMQADPGPGGLASALTYSIANSTIGDLFLTDPTTGTSDIIRFNGDTLVFYSLAGGSDLADTGLPSSDYANTFTLVENTLGPTVYSPTGTMPGSQGVFPVTYTFTSSELAAGVPDSGTTATLFGFSLAGLAFLRRKLA
jgi:hypothetical protein